MNSNLKIKNAPKAQKHNYKTVLNFKIKQPKLSIKGLHRIDDIWGETWLDKTYMDSKIKMTQKQKIWTD